MSGIYDITNGQCASTITVDGGPVRCSLAIDHDGWAHQHDATLWPSLPTREQIDDAMVERAARAMFEDVYGEGDGWTWDDVIQKDGPDRADIWRADARAVLEAALIQNEADCG